MAILRTPIKGRKPPSYGARIVVRVSSGRAIMQAWPRKRGRGTNPITKAQNELFKERNTLAKYAPGEDQWMAIEIARNSPLYPRDLLMSAMAGRLFETITVDGQEFKSVAVRDDISADLDTVAGTVKGTLLVRGNDIWEALVPTNDGLVLTSNGPDETPSYQSAGAGGSLAQASNIPLSIFSGSAFATKGFPFRASADFTIDSIGAQINGTTGHTYKGYLLAVDATLKITAITATTADVPSQGTLSAFYMADFTSQAVLSAGQRYVLAWGRIDGADTFVFRSKSSNAIANMIGLPAEPVGINATIGVFARLAKAVPAINDTFNTGTGGSFYTVVNLTI